MAKSLVRVFSGIQPTGVPHLGNYFGAIRQWIKLANDREIDPSQYEIKRVDPQPKESTDYDNKKSEAKVKCDEPIFSIVDVHAYTSPRTQFGKPFYENVLSTTASLVALGLNPDRCILFRQSDILEHYYLDNIFDNFITTQRLSRMIQYKEKTKGVGATKGVPNGLLTYPVLQAADILLYKASLVPVGEDQTQHIELTRDIARSFNTRTSSNVFPEPSSLLHKSTLARRIKSLRDPTKKMSKSDPVKKSCIEVVDEPDILREKIKKAITDSISEVYYDAENRPGLSNLMRIHHLATGESLEQIRERFVGVDTANYKHELADFLIEHFRQAREDYGRIRSDRAFLEEILRSGFEKAHPIARETVLQVKKSLGSISDNY